MLNKTEAIVLALQKHNDVCSILHLYTREHGRVQYMVYGRKGTSRQRKNGINLNILHPLSLIEITSDNNPVKQMPTLCSASLSYIPERTYASAERQCIALFIAEALYKTLRHPMEDREMFDYLSEIVRELDLADSVEHIPACFLKRLSELLGYGGESIEELSEIKSTELLRAAGMLV